MARILFLAHRAPFPPDKGEKIRAFHILRHLASKHDVWLGALTDQSVDPVSLAWAKRHCREVCIPVRHPVEMLIHVSAALGNGAPFSVKAFSNRELKRWSADIFSSKNIDIVYVFSSAMAQYALGAQLGGATLVVDFVDFDSEKWRQYGARRRGPWRWLYALEAARLEQFDKAVAAAAKSSIFVSQSERRLFERCAPELKDQLRVISNGVDFDHFRPDPLVGNRSRQAPLILFVGTMDYFPNVDGALWFAREIFPIVRESVKDARFRIVGANPTAEIRNLARRPGIEVTGTVADVRPFYADADVVVAPLRIARGIQNKVLEAMAMAKPLVTTPEALEGIAANDGQHVLVARTAEEIAQAVAKVLLGSVSADLGMRARAQVVEQHNWATQLALLDDLIRDCTRSS